MRKGKNVVFGAFLTLRHLIFGVVPTLEQQKTHTRFCPLFSDLDRKKVDKAMKELKADGAIVSPVRCKWEPAEK